MTGTPSSICWLELQAQVYDRLTLSVCTVCNQESEVEAESEAIAESSFKLITAFAGNANTSSLKGHDLGTGRSRGQSHLQTGSHRLNRCGREE